MDVMLDFVTYGENVLADRIYERDMRAVLRCMDEQLGMRGYAWRDVSLLILLNSKAVEDRKDQPSSDAAITGGLDIFCSEKGWYPPLLGCTVHSTFYQNKTSNAADINDGLLLIAVVSEVFDKIPVAFEESPKDAGRKYTAKHVVAMCLDRYRAKLADEYNIHHWGIQEIIDSSTGLLFTSGSGHVERHGFEGNREFIDFSDCYSLGQVLIDAWSEARIVGGCASNRSDQSYQGIYHSEPVAERAIYKVSYSHGAAVAFIPFMTPRLVLLHPFSYSSDPTPLDIEWDHQGAYDDGRYYLIKKINGQEPVDFLAQYWSVTKDQLVAMEAERTPIPADPRTYKYTIATSRYRNDDNYWPNVPVWFERDGDKLLLRLVRAEAEESRSYLMVMGNESSRTGIDAIRHNCEQLVLAFQSTTNRRATLLSFICESRKYLLNSEHSNLEAESLMEMLPNEAQVIGIYINGEYSLGSRKSIGYHNFSQISAISADRPSDELPKPFTEGKIRNTRVKIFVSHASRDKALIGAIIDGMGMELRGLTVWLDEQQIPTAGDFTREIRAAINDSDTRFVLVFISSTALKSDWVRNEVGWAMAEEEERGSTFIVPVLLDDVWKELQATWPASHVEYLKSKKYLMLREYSADAIDAFSRQLARDIQTWIARGVGDRALSYVSGLPPQRQDESAVKEPAGLMPVGPAERHAALPSYAAADHVIRHDVHDSVPSNKASSATVVPTINRRSMTVPTVLLVIGIFLGFASWLLNSGRLVIGWNGPSAVIAATVAGVSLVGSLILFVVRRPKHAKER